MTDTLTQATGAPFRAAILFVDLLGFTPISEKLGPEVAYSHVSAGMGLLDEIVRRHRGSMDKFLGDAFLALFGHPLPLDAPSASAVRAALEMRQAVADYNRDAALEIPLELCVGIHAGTMMSGVLGGSTVREFHVLGDAVNTAARLKSKAPPGSIYVGPEAWEETRHLFEFAPAQSLELKGKARPVETRPVLGERPGALGPATEETRIFGRVHEISRFDEAARGLASNRGGIVVLRGPSGVGKSRLLAALASACDSHRVLRSVASSFRRDEPLQALAGLVRGCAPAGEEVTASHVRAVLSDGGGASEPAVRALLGLLDPQQDDPPPVEMRAHLMRLLQGFAAQGPVVVLLDQFFWADTHSIESLPALLALAREAPILFGVSSRTPESELVERTFVRIVALGDGVDVLEIGNLEEDEARALAEACIPDSDRSDETVELVLERGGGNPERIRVAASLAHALRSESRGGEASLDRASEAERRPATVLFADITGFTALSEQLAPEESYKLVSGCLLLMDEIARKHGGTVDKYIGDCVLGLFGIPQALEDSARAAVNAAIEMVPAVRQYSEDHGFVGGLDLHVGVNTGTAIAGELGGSMLREFAVMGDLVVIASELTDHAPGGRIYVGSETRRLTEHAFDYQPTEAVVLKGRERPIESFELVSRVQRLHRARVSHRAVRSPLVGRDDELRTLEDALVRLEAGRGGIVSVVAEAGVGKSRLLAEVAESASAGRTGWREGRAISTGQQLSYHPFGDLCRGWVGIEEGEPPESARARLRDVLAAAVADEADEIAPFIEMIMGLSLSDAQQERIDRIQDDSMEQMIRSAITRLLRRNSQVEPLTIVLDDLHWADRSSLELLESLLPLVEERPILFVLVFRPGYEQTTEPLRERMRAAHGEKHLEVVLSPLADRDARALIRNLFPEGLPHETRTLIEKKARGNPFYIEEVIRSLIDEGAVEVVGSHLRATDAIRSAKIPGTVQEAILGRVDRIPLRRRTLLQAASIVGQTFRASLLEDFEPDSEALALDLDELVEAEFLVSESGSGVGEYAFKHPLTHEVVYDGILAGRREKLHCQVGEAIELRIDPTASGYHGMLAYHFSKGRDPERAEPHLFLAGDEAASVAASSEALHFFQEASKLYFEMHGEGGEDAKKAALEKNVGLALYHRGRNVEADAHFNQALRHLGESVPESDRALLLRSVRNATSVLAGLYLPRVLRRTAANDTDREVIDLMMRRAEAQTTGSPQRFLFDTLQTVVRLDQVDAHTVPGAGGMFAGVVGIFAYGGLSFPVSRRALARSHELMDPEDPEERLFYGTMSFLHHLLEGDWSDEHALDDATLEEGLSTGRLWPVTNYLNLDGLKQIFQGHYAAAGQRIGWLREVADRYQHDLALSAAEALTAIRHLERRELDEADAALERYYDANPEPQFKVSALGNRAEVALWRGDLDTARAHLDGAGRHLEQAGRILPYHKSSYARARFHLDVAELEREGGRSDRALRTRTRASRRVALSVARNVAWRRPEVLRLCARHAWALGRERQARREWERALAACEALGARPDLARAHREIALRAGRGGSVGVAGRSPEDHHALARAGFETLGLSAEVATADPESPEKAKCDA